MKAVGILIPMTMSLLLSLLDFPQVSAICCRAGACFWCADCTRTTPYCATGSCNIFGCNCDGSCRAGVLCPIGAVDWRGGRVKYGPHCNFPGEEGDPLCGILVPGQTTWKWVHACESRGRWKRAVFELENDSNSLAGNSNSQQSNQMYKNVSQIVESADQNSDGKLNLFEVVDFFRNTPHRDHHHQLQEIEIKKAFKEMDKNGDEFLSSSEIDKF